MSLIRTADRAIEKSVCLYVVCRFCARPISMCVLTFRRNAGKRARRAAAAEVAVAAAPHVAGRKVLAAARASLAAAVILAATAIRKYDMDVCVPYVQYPRVINSHRRSDNRKISLFVVCRAHFARVRSSLIYKGSSLAFRSPIPFFSSFCPKSNRRDGTTNPDPKNRRAEPSRPGPWDRSTHSPS